jgi:hypothetical protein
LLGLLEYSEETSFIHCNIALYQGHWKVRSEQRDMVRYRYEKVLRVEKKQKATVRTP